MSARIGPGVANILVANHTRSRAFILLNHVHPAPTSKGHEPYVANLSLAPKTHTWGVLARRESKTIKHHIAGDRFRRPIAPPFWVFGPFYPHLSSLPSTSMNPSEVYPVSSFFPSARPVSRTPRPETGRLAGGVAPSPSPSTEA